MLRWFCVVACLFMLACASSAFADTPVSLRQRIEASGPAITIGDVFDGAGADVAGRALAPSPGPGQVSTLNVAFLQAAAASAGLAWTAPPGVTDVRVVRPGGMRAMLGPSNAAGGASGGDVAVRRGETIALIFNVPGVRLTTRVRATQDGAIGDSIRVVNTVSNRTLDAIVTGPGAASVALP